MRGLLALLALAAACDSKASATDPQGGARAEQKSKEYESCGASMHCQDDLRCFDNTCRRMARSNVGDYQAAYGAAARSRGDLEASITAYATALGQYEAEKLSVPPDVDCAYGAALAAAKSVNKNAEQAARVLHRCILSVPAGSSLRTQALAQLATLADVGLDPLLLGANKPADLYLTKGPAKPSVDKVNVIVVANPVPSGKSYAKVPEKLSAPDVKPALIACWEKYNAATRKDELTVTIGLKVAFVGNPDYEEEGSWLTKVDPAAAGASGDEACVRAAVEPALKALRLTDAINSKLAITIK
ncbi:MAG: hypothetical protein ABI867_44290 [Kofleriaceae bacterium]